MERVVVYHEQYYVICSREILLVRVVKEMVITMDAFALH